jgi:hypothetical protein
MLLEKRILSCIGGFHDATGPAKFVKSAATGAVRTGLVMIATPGINASWQPALDAIFLFDTLFSPRL